MSSTPQTLMEKLLKVKGPTLLVVEGRDEKEFLTTMLRSMGDKTVQVLSSVTEQQHPDIVIAESDSKVLEIIADLKVLLQASNGARIRTIGLMIDADKYKIDGRIAQIKERLEDGVRKLPAPTESGTFVQDEDGLRIGVFVMPGNELKSKPDGRPVTMFEDLVMESIDPKARECVEAYFDCRGFKDDHFHYAKRFVYTYLACIPQRDAVSISKSAKENPAYWNFDHPCFEELKAFLSQFRETQA